jgi:hypothetical protein
MRRVLVTGSRAWTGTPTIRGTLAPVWAGGTAVMVPGTCRTGAERTAETIRTLAPDLPGGLCAGHPTPACGTRS